MTNDTLDQDVQSFRLKARAWLSENMPRRDQAYDGTVAERDREETWLEARRLQRLLYDGGFAGICFPREYGGQGLSPEHQHAFTEESLPYQMPLLLNVPTLTILAPTILDFGTEEQKLRHLPAILKGDEVWVQFLSEPRGGSDLAGVTTRATPDGDLYVLNGAKTWSTSANFADYALCLARTDWDATKHRGLSMFILKIHQPGITINQIRQLNGSDEFCEEFFDDVSIPAEDLVGEENAGWSVASRLLVHERNAVGGGSPYESGQWPGSARGSGTPALPEIAARTGQRENPHVRGLVAEAHVLGTVREQLIERVGAAVARGTLPEPAGALLRLFAASSGERLADIGLEVAGRSGVVWHSADPAWGGAGEDFLMRQAGSLGGGSSEMQRNIISERVLGMPREAAADREIPFRQVRQGRSVTSA